MANTFERVVDPSVSDDQLRDLIREASSEVTATISAARFAAAVYVAKRTVAAASAVASSLDCARSDLVTALTSHREAMEKAASSSERYARRLSWATWALVGATVVLVVVTLVVGRLAK